MVTIKPITSEAVAGFKAVRLAALQDTPSAFGSTYAKESLLSDAQWEQRLAKWNGDRSMCYLAWNADRPCGIAAGFLDQDDATQAHLASMWVAPSHRGRGVGRLLVDGIIDWARGQHAENLRLTVTSNNDVASRFYERMGFRMTGNTQAFANDPALNDPALTELEMIRPIGARGGSVAE
jgi:GNAT superfamily N-acetyltransferase